MNLTCKLIIPLCEKVIPKEFLTKEAGFVDAFTVDMDLLQCDSHITLLYEFIINNAQKARRFECFRRSGLKHETRKINGNWYVVYHIRANTHEIGMYRIWGSAGSIVGCGPMLKVIKYWNTEDKEINDLTLHPLKPVKWEDTYLPSTKFEIAANFTGITIQKPPKEP